MGQSDTLPAPPHPQVELAALGNDEHEPGAKHGICLAPPTFPSFFPLQIPERCRRGEKYTNPLLLGRTKSSGAPLPVRIHPATQYSSPLHDPPTLAHSSPILTPSLLYHLHFTKPFNSPRSNSTVSPTIQDLTLACVIRRKSSGRKKRKKKL